MTIDLPTVDDSAAPGHVQHRGLDLTMDWKSVRLTLSGIREGREGVRGELLVSVDGRRVAWGAWNLPSIQTRESFAKKLAAMVAGVPWGALLDEAAFAFTHAARRGEPMVVSRGEVAPEPTALVPGFLYPGNPTVLYADGETGKTLTATALAVAVASGTPVATFTPTRSTPTLYLDWETDYETFSRRHARIAAGLGIPPPDIHYQRIGRPFVDVANAIAGECVERGVGFVVLDSQTVALASSDGGAFHESVTRFYVALRLLGADVSSLVLNHVTNADARNGSAPRPFGGAFAYNLPRLIWEAKRDPDAEDATALAFTCRKANNFSRRPPPFGLRFADEGERGVIIRAWDLQDAAPSTLAGVSLGYRIRLALDHEAKSAETLAAEIEVSDGAIRKTLSRLRVKGGVVPIEGSKPQLWALAAAWYR